MRGGAGPTVWRHAVRSGTSWAGWRRGSKGRGGAGLAYQGLASKGQRRRKNDGRQEEERTRFGKRLTARGSSTPGMGSSRIWKLYSLIGMALPCPTKQPKESLGFLLHPNTILIYATRWWPVPTARVRTLSCRL
jgi:hypothetical protein